MQIRLFHWQVEKISAMRCPVAAVLRLAVKRHNRGDFTVPESKVAQKLELLENFKKVPHNWELVPCSVKSRLGLPDPMIRNILMWHWLMPDNNFKSKCNREINQLDTEINGYMQALTNTQYIREDNEE